MTSSQKVAAGLGAGVLVGLFFGERAAVLDVVADGFVRLLQMTVLPYVTISIVSSLGQLDYHEARRLGARVGAAIASLWLVALVFAFLIPLAFPTIETADFFSTTLVEPRAAFDLVALYIPANPFHSLANNVVPSVVLFSVLIGLSLIGVDRKATLLDVLQVAREAVSRATKLVSRLIPVGLFAIAATAAGTLDVEELGQIQVFLVTYTAVGLFLSLWVLPGLVAAFTPIPLTDLLKTTRDALVTAFAAGDLFIVLPALIDGSKTLMARHGAPVAEAMTLPDVIVPASFNFPHTGKLLSVSFILFAGWLADATVPVAEYPRLAFTALVSFFGSLNSAVPFLLDLFRIPADTFQLFLATGVINSHVGTLLAAVHTVTVCLLGTCALTGALRWQRRAVVRYAAITVAGAVVVVGGSRVLCATLLAPEYRKDQTLAGMQLLLPPATLVAASPVPATGEPRESGGVLRAVSERGVLRVGYLPDSLPFAFVNGRGDVVGFDIDLANRLASELGVRLMLVPLPRGALESSLAQGQCDIVMSGVAVTTDRARALWFSSPYLDETLALVVHDHDRDRLGSWEAINASSPVTIAVPNVPYLLSKIRELAPRATFVPITSAAEAFGPASAGFDAIALPAERGSAWTLLHPQFSVVVPAGALVKIPLAYPVAAGDQAFAAFLNTWLEMKRKDGTLDALFKHWILGQNAAARRPRWSVLRDVLHWVD
jgi:Na+/H+-dicarboxylate symporter/ABC-type amino acid transport substrate-binding protein